MESISRAGENQFGAKVPTETTAIFNVTPKKQIVQVVRYGIPTLEKREEAGTAYNDAISGGLSECEALEYAAMECGIPEDFQKMIPEWAKSCKTSEKRLHTYYSEEQKIRAVKLFRKYSKDYGVTEGLEMMNAELGLHVERSMIYKWKRKLEKQGKIVDDPIRKKRVVKESVKREEEHKPVSVQKCAHCGKEVPPFTGFMFCPFCGKPLESEKEYALRMGESLKAVLIQKGFAWDMITIVDAMLNVIRKGE